MITVPEQLADGTIEREGDSGRQWIERLPELAESYLEHWRCVPDGPVACGAVALIIPVRSPQGPAVIKISYTHPGNVGEPSALALWQGSGAVELYDHEPADYAMLIERVRRRTLDVPVDEGLVIGGELSTRLAVPAPPEMSRLADQAAGWADQLRDQDRQLGHPLPDRVTGAALETIDELARSTDATMLHGDLHGGNILHSDRGWVAIDPKGIAGPREFDTMTMCGYRYRELLDRSDLKAEILRRIAIFCDAAGLDAELARRCCQARLTSSALWDLLRDGAGHDPARIRFAPAAAEQLL